MGILSIIQPLNKTKNCYISITSLSPTHSILNDTALVKQTLTMAVRTKPANQTIILHSDQGPQYRAAAYLELSKTHKLQQSMSRKGECHDNAVAESFFGTLKSELVYQTRYKTRDEARSSIFEYIEVFYNRVRSHSYLNYQSPLTFESAHYNKIQYPVRWGSFTLTPLAFFREGKLEA